MLSAYLNSISAGRQIGAYEIHRLWFVFYDAITIDLCSFAGLSIDEVETYAIIVTRYTYAFASELDDMRRSDDVVVFVGCVVVDIGYSGCVGVEVGNINVDIFNVFA